MCLRASLHNGTADSSKRPVFAVQWQAPPGICPFHPATFHPHGFHSPIPFPRRIYRKCFDLAAYKVCDCRNNLPLTRPRSHLFEPDSHRWQPGRSGRHLSRRNLLPVPDNTRLRLRCLDLGRPRELDAARHRVQSASWRCMVARRISQQTRRRKVLSLLHR